MSTQIHPVLTSASSQTNCKVFTVLALQWPALYHLIWKSMMKEREHFKVALKD